MADLLLYQVDFNLFFDSEPLNQTDLVVWANVGTHHFPRAEDAPFTPLTEARAGLLLSPFNFLDSDLSAEFSNSVLVRQSILFCNRMRRADLTQFYGENDPQRSGHRKYVQQYWGPEASIPGLSEVSQESPSKLGDLL